MIQDVLSNLPHIACIYTGYDAVVEWIINLTALKHTLGVGLEHLAAKEFHLEGGGDQKQS